MPSPPSRLIQEKFNASVTRIIRRVEIYHFNGETPWRPDLWPRILVDGSVGIDMNADARRSVDLELDNSDGELDPSTGGLWYDKVLKVFYGIHTDAEKRSPRIIIVEEHQSVGQALALKTLLARAGVSVVHYDPQIDSLDQVEDFDILISISATHTQKLTLLTQAFNQGKSVMTFGVDATTAQLPYIIGASASALSTSPDELREFERLEVADPIMLGWGADWLLNPPHSYRKINAVAPGAVVLANTYDPDNGFSPGIVLRSELGGPLWLHVQQSQFHLAAFDSGTDAFAAFLAAAIKRLDYYVPAPTWEIQIGEYVPDGIEDSDDLAQRIRFIGRDYTKRCLGSKLTKATMFKKDEKIEDVIKTLALNCKIFKINLPVTSKTLGKDMTWERDTDRWSIMKEIALANNYELYFDNEGWLVMREQRDPLTTPPSLVLKTGEDGNIVARSAKTGDSQLKNHVTVVGESSDASVPLVFGEAINNNPNSPSAVDKIGERTENISSPLVTTEAQATALAKTRLSVAALEEFEANFTAIALPWLEVGDVVEFGDPEGSYWGPTRYLITNLNIPLDMGPMTGTAKRVTRVS